MLCAAVLLRGLLYDPGLALILLFTLSLLFLSKWQSPFLFRRFYHTGLLIITTLFIILLLQLALPFSLSPVHLPGSVDRSLLALSPSTLVSDEGAWVKMLGRWLFYSLLFIVAAKISTNPSASRTFLIVLLASNLITITITFVLTESHSFKSSGNFTHSFVNPNHAASFLGVILLLLLWKIHRFFRFIRKRKKQHIISWIDSLSLQSTLIMLFLLFSLLLCSFALFLTGSRSALACIFVAFGCFATIVIVKKRLRYHKPVTAIITAFVGLFVLLPMLFAGIMYLEDQKREEGRQGVLSSHRVHLYSGTVDMITDYPLLGVGLGGFPEAFSAYRPPEMAPDGTIMRAHNTYLEFAAEMGIPALLCLLTAAGLYLRQYLIALTERRKHYGLATLGISIWLLMAFHSLIDFPLQIPAVAAMVITISTICAGQSYAYGDVKREKDRTVLRPDQPEHLIEIMPDNNPLIKT